MKKFLKGLGVICLACLLTTQVSAMGEKHHDHSDKMHMHEHDKGMEKGHMTDGKCCGSEACKAEGKKSCCGSDACKAGEKKACCGSEACKAEGKKSCCGSDACKAGEKKACCGSEKCDPKMGECAEKKSCDSDKKDCKKRESCESKQGMYWGKSKVYVKFRPRLESVDTTSDAFAGTARVAVGGKVLFPKYNMKAVVEATSVLSYLQDYNSGSAIAGGVNASKATIADPEQSRFTKLYLGTKIGNAKIKVGNRPINIDDSRFIGSVNWRQMPQTFSGASLDIKPMDNAKAYVAFLTRRYGVIPENDKKFEKGSILVHGEYHAMDELEVHGFAYLLEDIHNTIGVKGTGTVSVGDYPVHYKATYAIQRTPTMKTDAYTGTNASSFYSVGAKTHVEGVSVGVGYESFGAKGSGSTGFSTPFATLHGHNGWSDVMASKAASGDDNGFTDMHVSVAYEPIFGSPTLAFHSFSSVENSTTYGSEIDLKLSRKLSPRTNLVFKAAMFNAEDGVAGVTDTNKYWLYASTTF